MLPILQKNKIPIHCCGEYRTTMDLRGEKKRKARVTCKERTTAGRRPKEGRLSEGAAIMTVISYRTLGRPPSPSRGGAAAAALASPLLIEKVSSLPSPLPFPPLSVAALPGLEPRPGREERFQFHPPPPPPPPLGGPSLRSSSSRTSRRREKGGGGGALASKKK